ncbi:MAG: hypothetical protein GEU89_21230 [Kiloniellaceae bacterium]|nr:hypothetical protein [Kiloniellaceae bacterium]
MLVQIIPNHPHQCGIKLSMDETLGKVAARRKAKRAKAQRKYAAKRTKKGIPSSDDLARAVLAAVCRGYRDEAPSVEEAKRVLSPLLTSAVSHLVERGFDRKEATDRLVNAVFRKDTSR